METLQEYIEAVEKNKDKVTPTARKLVVVCADAAMLGCNWGLLPEGDADYLFDTKPTEAEEHFIKCRKVDNGYVVEVEREYLKAIINTFVPGSLGFEYDSATACRYSDERLKFDRFLNRVFSGKDRHLYETDSYYVACIGLYSVNEVQQVQVDGVEYPAYRLNIEEFLERLHYKALSEGRLDDIGIKVKKADGSKAFVKLGNMYKNASDKNNDVLQAIIAGLTISDTNRSVFIELKIRK